MTSTSTQSSASGGRAAHASIAGYYAQVVRAAFEWTRIAQDEALVIEGDEDFDKVLLNGTQIVATTPLQHKAVSKRIGWDADVQRSVLGFVASFARHHKANRKCSPTYISTSDAAAVEVIERWSTFAALTPSQQSALVEQVKADLGAHAQLDPKKEGVFAAEARAGVKYLGDADGRWHEFVAATRWEFGAASDAENLINLQGALRTRGDTGGMLIEDLALRVVFHVLNCAKDPSVLTRTLAAGDLSTLIATAKTTLESWASSTDAAVFFETLDLNRLLDESSQRIASEYRHGSIDQQGGPRLLRSSAREALRNNNGVLLVTGERGTGKTSAVAEWARDELADGRAVAWITCREKSSDVDSFLKARGYRRGSALLGALSQRGIALVVDALDQGRDAATLAALVELVERAADAHVRTIALVRQQHVDSNPSVTALAQRFSTTHLDPFTEQELEILLGNASTPPAFPTLWQSLSARMKTLVCIPLHTHFLWQISLKLPAGAQEDIGTLAELFELYWKLVVRVDGDGIAADVPLAEVVRRMLREERMAAGLDDIPNVEVLHALVRAYVLTHPRVPRFGINDGEVSFAFDAVFDYAVFRLLWMNAPDATVCSSLASSRAFAASLSPSFRFVLEFRAAARGPRAAVALAGAIYDDGGIDIAARERFAREFANWVAQDAAHRAALIAARKDGAKGVASLLTKVLVSKGATS
jgi:hypothetical protein